MIDKMAIYRIWSDDATKNFVRDINVLINFIGEKT